MNIFVTDNCPIKSAKALDDKRLIKMCLETAQLLATAIQLNGGTATYRPTHANHPCAIFVRSSQGNYVWALSHFAALCQEYEARFKKQHKCFSLIEEFIKGKQFIPNGELTNFVNCTTYKEELDIFKAYKDYLISKWNTDKRPAKWTNARKPNFYDKNDNAVNDI